MDWHLEFNVCLEGLWSGTTSKHLSQCVVCLLAVCRVQRKPQCNGTALARLHRLYAMVITSVEANYTTTSRHHRRLYNNKHTHTLTKWPDDHVHLTTHWPDDHCHLHTHTLTRWPLPPESPSHNTLTRWPLPPESPPHNTHTHILTTVTCYKSLYSIICHYEIQPLHRMLKQHDWILLLTHQLQLSAHNMINLT